MLQSFPSTRHKTKSDANPVPLFSAFDIHNPHINPKRCAAWLLSFLLAFVHTRALADHPTPAFGTEASGPINTISALQLGRGRAIIGLRTEIINTEPFSDEALEGFAARGIEGVHSLGRLSSTSLALAYGWSDDLTISMRLPYVKRSNIREGELEAGAPEVHAKGGSAGLGDALFFGQYRFWKNDAQGLSLLLGVKAPTGKTNVSNLGERLETELQPGSGSWDLLSGLALSTRRGRMAYHANVLYNKTARGTRDTDLGDAFFYNAALGYRLGIGDSRHAHPDSTGHSHLAWDLLLELNGEWRGRNKVAGEVQPHSGGNQAYLSPGVRLSSNTGWTGFLSLGIPVWKDPHGEQAEIRYRLVGGIGLQL